MGQYQQLAKTSRDLKSSLEIIGASFGFLNPSKTLGWGRLREGYAMMRRMKKKQTGEDMDCDEYEVRKEQKTKQEYRA